MVGPEWLETYAETLAQYHLHPEAKFGNGDFTDSGFTTRRHVVAQEVEHIGKEANRWEEQFYLGENPETQIVYGTAPEDAKRMRGSVLREMQSFGVRALAQEAGVSVGLVSAVKRGRGQPKREILLKLLAAIRRLAADAVGSSSDGVTKDSDAL